MHQADYLMYFTLCVLTVLRVAFASIARAGEPPETALLAATPELGGDSGRTILIAKQIDSERHAGVTLNRPTRTPPAARFLEHEPSSRIIEPLRRGGPVAVDTVFALVQAQENSGEGSLRLAPGLFLATAGALIDRIIEHQPDRARFFLGVVVWEPGELAAEIARGSWFVRPVDTAALLRTPTEGMWEELVHRSRAVTANLLLDRWWAAPANTGRLDVNCQRPSAPKTITGAASMFNTSPVRVGG